MHVWAGLQPDAARASAQQPGPRCVLQDSPFWTEHSYGPNTPYFSYLHKLGHREKSRLDAVIGYLHDQAVRHFPGAKRAKCVTVAATMAGWRCLTVGRDGRREAAWLSHPGPSSDGLWRHHHLPADTPSGGRTAGRMPTGTSCILTRTTRAAAAWAGSRGTRSSAASCT
jgi:hypothetical protein